MLKNVVLNISSHQCKYKYKKEISFANIFYYHKLYSIQLSIILPNFIVRKTILLNMYKFTRSSSMPVFCPSEIDLPEKDNEVGAKTEVTIQDSLHKSPAKSVRTEMTAASTMTLFTSPNMAEVYFKGSYEEYTRKRQPVNPKSVCWTAKQEAYVGCAGGQLIVVEPDTCSVTLLVNPLPAAEVE